MFWFIYVVGLSVQIEMKRKFHLKSSKKKREREKEQCFHVVLHVRHISGYKKNMYLNSYKFEVSCYLTDASNWF